MKNYEDLTIQIAITKQGIKLGKILQKDHPEIAELYRDKNTLSEIVKKLDFQSHEHNNSVVYLGVYYAIEGHDGRFKIESYDGLISEEERKNIGNENKQESEIKFSKIKMGRYW
jgi:hypothetical protein